MFFATDIHGSDRCFKKWVNAAQAYKATVLILGGDITGKALVPVITSSGAWRASLDGEEIFARGPDEQMALEMRIRSTGRYEVLMSADELRELESSDRVFEARFRQAMRESVTRWVELADERLAGLGTSCFVILGNDDTPELAELIRQSDVLTYAEDGLCELPGGYELLSFGYSTPTPWHTPRELSEEDMAAQLNSLARQLKHPERSVFNVHCPPKGTHLDQAPQLDDQLRPVANLGGQQFISVGSSAVREAIERYRPILGLHGHVHESSAAEKIGDTLCINPGSEYFLGNLRGAIVELGHDQEGLLRWQMTQG